jgi:hypothetical protein
MTAEARLTFSSSESPENLLSSSIKAFFSVSGGGLAALFLFALLGFRERGLFLDFLCIGSSWSMFGSMLDLWKRASG